VVFLVVIFDIVANYVVVFNISVMETNRAVVPTMTNAFQIPHYILDDLCA